MSQVGASPTGRGLRGDAAIVGIVEWPIERKTRPEQRQLLTEQWADLAASALADAGLASADVNGMVCSNLRESNELVPSTVSEYLGWELSYAERMDVGGAFAAGGLWRAASAIELGMCDVVVLAGPNRHRPTPTVKPPASGWWAGASSDLWGSPQAEFEIPYGFLGQNALYAMAAQRYGAQYGYDHEALALLVEYQRFNALGNPNAVFCDRPVSAQDVLDSRMIADPLRLLEVVMPCVGGAAVVVASREVAERCQNHKPVWIVGCGERISHKSPTQARDLLDVPLTAAARQAYAMAGIAPADVDTAQIYDSYSITVLLSLEALGFCPPGQGAKFVREHDLRWSGDFPVNTNGGQLGCGQPGRAAGLVHVIEAVRQLRGEAHGRQVENCRTSVVTGSGGILSEQVAVVLQAD